MNQSEADGIFRHGFTVTGNTVDQNGHVNNIVYIQWMQDAAVLHSDSCGCTQATQKAGATWVVRSHRIEYLSPAFAGDRVVAFTWVVNFRRVRSLRRYKFIGTNSNEILAFGETDWVFVDSKTGRPRQIPKEITQLFRPVPQDKKP